MAGYDGEQPLQKTTYVCGRKSRQFNLVNSFFIFCFRMRKEKRIMPIEQIRDQMHSLPWSDFLQSETKKSTPIWSQMINVLKFYQVLFLHQKDFN